MNHSYKSEFKYFHRIYFYGLIVPVIISFTKMLLVLTDQILGTAICKVFNNPESTNNLKLDEVISITFLLWGVLSVCLLYYRAKKDLDEKEKEKKVTIDVVGYFRDCIQVEGYLHTLIGFFMAILGLAQVSTGQGEVNVSLIAFPIGMALTTSILGWGFGNDLVNYFRPKEIDLDGPVSRLRNSISNLSVEINSMVSVYGVAKREFESSLSSLSGQVRKMETTYEETSKKYKNNMNELHEAQYQFMSQTNEHFSNTIEMNERAYESVEGFIKKVEEELGEIEIRIKNNLLQINTVNEKNIKKVLNDISTKFIDISNKINKSNISVENILTENSSRIGRMVEEEKERYKEYLRNNINKMVEVHDSLENLVGTSNDYLDFIRRNKSSESEILENNVKILHDISGMVSNLKERINSMNNK